MPINDRKAQILEVVTKKRSATVQELKEELGVSESTIRRDIATLNREGKLIKVHGGAVALDEIPSAG